MGQYALLVYQDEARVPERTTADWEASVVAHRRFIDLVAQGPSSLVGSVVLEPTSTATTVRADLVTDGPFLDTKEALGGLYLLEAEDLDEALRVAALCPAELGGVEVRPLLPIQ